MKKVFAFVIAGIIMLMLVTACNNRPVNNGNETITAAMTETGITVAEESKIVWIKQSFLTNDRFKSLSMALESMEYHKAHGELVTRVVVEEDEDWPGWYRAWFKSTITAE